MFKIVRLKLDDYLVIRNNKSYFGNLREIYKLLHSWEVAFEEISTGIRELELNGHDIAEYGVHKTFIFSKTMKIRDEFLAREYN